MKTYDCILFDADDTLFHFDAQAGLQRMFAGFGVAFGAQEYAEYGELNRSLWLDYQRGVIDAKCVQRQRFAPWAQRLQVDAARLNSAFLSAMAELCRPLDGAVELLHALQGHARLGIVTNGFTELQQVRLERTGLRDCFEVLVISEEVGVAKPHPAIFERALAQMTGVAHGRVLMVGDNPDTDIRGALDAGMEACWFNPSARATPEGIAPHYQVASLVELRERLLSAYGDAAS